MRSSAFSWRDEISELKVKLLADYIPPMRSTLTTTLLLLGCATALVPGRAPNAPKTHRRAGATMRELPLAGTSAAGAEQWDEAWGTSSFADLELKGVWERTGKGKKRWAPGDTTGDAVVDASLLYSTWLMNKPDLYMREECPSCGAARFALGHMRFPFELKLATADDSTARAMAKFNELDADGNGFLEGAELETLAKWVWASYQPEEGGAPLSTAETKAMVETLMRTIDENSDGRLSPSEFDDYFGAQTPSTPHPMLDGQGVPGLVGALPIVSFAAANAQKGKIAPATGRPDVASWIVAADAGTAELDVLAAMLGGVHPTDQSPCLNAWGFGIDDALVLPYLRNLQPSAADLDEWPAVVRAYLEMASERCGVPLLA